MLPNLDTALEIALHLAISLLVGFFFFLAFLGFLAVLTALTGFGISFIKFSQFGASIGLILLIGVFLQVNKGTLLGLNFFSLTSMFSLYHFV
ncbi:MAG: hypothetical protein MJ223_02745 [Mycoplasmoidaceae bacterium]|nr:hypothetical protein [Mycoplasmoidaceae bacterium]